MTISNFQDQQPRNNWQIFVLQMAIMIDKYTGRDSQLHMTLE